MPEVRRVQPVARAHTRETLALRLAYRPQSLTLSRFLSDRPHPSLDADPYSIIWMHAIQRRTAN